MIRSRAEQGQVRFRCTHCGRDLPAGGTQPCHFCGNVGRDIILGINERVKVKENLTAILGRLEIHLYYQPLDS